MLFNFTALWKYVFFASLVVPFVLFLCGSFPNRFEILFEVHTGYVLLVAEIFFFISFVKTTKDRRISNVILQKIDLCICKRHPYIKCYQMCVGFIRFIGYDNDIASGFTARLVNGCSGFDSRLISTIIYD